MRQCGDCQLCCKLLPVPPLNKRGGEKCKFQKFHKGCTVYNTPTMPDACKLWHCRWLINDDVDMPRPDRCHYVIDIMPDELALTDNETGERKSFAAIQVWVDPAHWDEVLKDEALFAWLFKKAKQHGAPALFRKAQGHAVGVIAPPISGGQWIIMEGTINPDMGLWK
jgi:hypothetical protein